MSSDLCILDDFSFSPFTDSPIHFLQDPIFEEDEISNLDQFSPNIFENLSISPKRISENHLNFESQFSEFPKIELKTQNFLTNPVFGDTDDAITNLDPPNKFENLSVSPKPNSQNEHNFETDFSDFSNLEVKTQGLQIPINSGLSDQSFGPHSYGGAENVERFMQRSYSSGCFNRKLGFKFRPNFDLLIENQIMISPESSLGCGQMRRVCSTGDLQKVTKAQGTNGSCSSGSPLGVDGSFIEEANYKVRQYSAEERKERINRYRAKRNQRNFSKTIKYACRKTLADNRPRVRGRFARNDETVEIYKTAIFNSYEEDDELWVDGYNEEERTVRGGTVFNMFGPTQFQNYGFS